MIELSVHIQLRRLFWMDKDQKKKKNPKPWTGYIDPGEIHKYIKIKQKKDSGLSSGILY